MRGESTHCMGKGIYVCLLMGNVGWEAWVSRVIGHWHGFPRQHARLRARGLLSEPRRGGMGPSAWGGHSLHGREACPHGHGMRRGSSMDGARSDCSCVRKLPTVSWACSLRISVSWALGWHGRPHAKGSTHCSVPRRVVLPTHKGKHTSSPLTPS